MNYESAVSLTRYLNSAAGAQAIEEEAMTVLQKRDAAAKVAAGATAALSAVEAEKADGDRALKHFKDAAATALAAKDDITTALAVSL